MKRIFNLFIISLLIISLPVILKADNELLNSGFESGDLSSWGGGLANSQVGTGEVHGGTYSYQINGDLGGGFSALNQTINVTSGQVVTFHAYVKIDSFASAGEDAGIGLKLESVGMGIYEETKLDAVTAGWVEISVTATATADGTMSCMIFQYNAGIVDAYFDNITAPEDGGVDPVDTYDTMNVVVSIFEEIIGVDFIATEYNFGTVSAGTVNVSSDAASIISNSGTCNEIYSFQITDPSGWSSSTTAPGANTFVLSGALSINVGGITWSLANHALSTTLQICTGTRFAGDETGVGVASGALRHLWLQFMAPTSSTIYTAQTIPITVSAEAE